MAPDQAVLKRKRSRPSDWWAAPIPTTTTPPQQDEPSRKQRSRPRTLEPTERIIHEDLEATSQGSVAPTQPTLSYKTRKATKSRRGRPPSHKDRPTLGERSSKKATTSRKEKGRPASGKLEEGTTSSVPAQSRTRRTRGLPLREIDDQAMLNRGEGGTAGAPAKDAAVSNSGNDQAVSASQLEDELAAESPVTVEPSKSRRRGRPPKTQKELELASATSPRKSSRLSERGGLPEENTRATVDRRVASLGAQNPLGAAVTENGITQSPVKNIGKPTTRGQRSEKVVEVQTATSSFSRTGKGQKNRNAVHNIAKASNDVSQDRPRKPQKESAGHKSQRSGPKRRPVESPVPEDDHENSETEEPLPYQHLAEVTRRVSRQTIESKWEPLPPNCIERISQLLNDLQRPVIVRLSGEGRRTQASTALQMVSRRLVSKISKGLPFPQSTGNRREDDFDFEKVLDYNRDMETQLTPALHANALLMSELEKETVRLEVEQEALSELETNAKGEAAMRKEASRKAHALLQQEPAADDAWKDGTRFVDDPYDLPLSLEDEDLKGVVKELGNHMESIQGNIHQVRDITQAMSRSRAAVQATLFDHVGRGQYEGIVLG